MNVKFKISGEGITALAREKCAEGKFGWAMELLISCMQGTDQTQTELQEKAFSILNGNARLKSIESDEEHVLFEYLDNPETDSAVNEMFESLMEKKEKLESELEQYKELYFTALGYIPEYKREKFQKEISGESSESAIGNSLLDGYMKRMMNDKEHTTGDYGWLEPDGTFHDVPWSEHQEFARKWLEKHGIKTEKEPGDYLSDRGWVLLHNPSQGIAFPTKAVCKRYTKAQKEFLYDYYMERDYEKEANDIFKE